MKRPILFPCILCLILGLLCGLILPAPWDEPAPAAPVTPAPSQSALADGESNTAPVKPAAPLDPEDNLSLLNTACAVVTALKHEDYSAVASMASPKRGVTFTPYSTVDPETDITLMPQQIKDISTSKNIYTWGFEDGRGSLLELTPKEYVARFVFNVDYTQAPEISVDQVNMTGNALENIAEAYPGCRFVDFTFPEVEPANSGLDWASLKLVFEPGQTRWLLVGIVHGEWTI